MNQKKVLYLLFYALPYIAGLFCLTEYLDATFPNGYPAVFLFVLLFVVYIGLGYLCGRERFSRLCIGGTLLQCAMLYITIDTILPLFYGADVAELQTWFPFLILFILLCQLIGYFGARKSGSI